MEGGASKYFNLGERFLSQKSKHLSCLLILVPRTFRLYEELEKGEKAKLSDQSVSYGLSKGKRILEWYMIVGDDTTFTDWNGTIIGPPNTKFDNRIFFLAIKCGPHYPMQAPEVSF